MRHLFVSLAVAALCLAGAAAAQTVVRHLEVEADLAEKEAVSLARRYEEARAREVATRARVDEAAGDLDARLDQEATPLDQLHALERRLAEARGAETAAEAEARSLRSRLLELRRRQELLAAELRRTRGAPADLPDPITGAWNLALEPGGRRGLLDLSLDGTTVSGTLGLDDGSFGSVRGTLTAGAVRLERVSAEGGLDMILEGRLGEGGSLQGTWRPLVLGRGESGGGTWTARKAPEEEEEAGEGGAR
jgi:hypothetical protein